MYSFSGTWSGESARRTDRVVCSCYRLPLSLARRLGHVFHPG